MKLKMFICFVLIILLSGCSANNGISTPREGDETLEEILNDNSIVEESSHDEDEEDYESEVYNNNSTKRVFIELEYFDTIENVDLSGWLREARISENENPEFTWWVYCGIPENYTIASGFISVEGRYRAFEYSVPEHIDRTKKAFIASFGRKLKHLYYDDVYAEPEEWGKAYHARPVFEKEYSHETVYLYLIDKIKLVDNEFYDNDMWDFNEKGLIPFELPDDEWIHDTKAFTDMDFESIGKISYEPTNRYRALTPASPIMLLNSSAGWSSALGGDFIVPADIDVNFDTHQLILSYGRQILQMECAVNPHYGESIYTLIFTFAEEHEGNQVFFYLIEKDKQFMPLGVFSPCYVMSGDEKIFYTEVYELNEKDPN